MTSPTLLRCDSLDLCPTCYTNIRAEIYSPVSTRIPSSRGVLLDEVLLGLLKLSLDLCGGRAETADALAGWVELKVTIGGAAGKITGKLAT
jgi:hypothetical protein